MSEVTARWKWKEGKDDHLTHTDKRLTDRQRQARGTHRSAWKRPNFLVRFLTIFALLRGVTFTMVPALCVRRAVWGWGVWGMSGMAGWGRGDDD